MHVLFSEFRVVFSRGMQSARLYYLFFVYFRARGIR